MPNGLIEQWGIDTNTTYGAFKKVLLPIKYTTFNALELLAYDSSAQMGKESNVYEPTKESFQWSFTSRQTQTAPFYVNWHTLGY